MQIDGDEVYGYHKFGLNIGASAIIPFSNNFSVSIENIFNQKGAYQKPRFEEPNNGAYKLNLNYLEVPILGHYEDKNKVNFGYLAGRSGSRKPKNYAVFIRSPFVF